MQKIKKRLYEMLVLLCLLILFVRYGESGAQVMPLVGDGIEIAGGCGENLFTMTNIVNIEWDIVKTAVDEAIAQGRYDALLAAREEKKRKEVMLENEERFYGLAGQTGLSQDEADACYQSLCQDNVFRDGIQKLIGYGIYDIDQNGHDDMAVILQDTSKIEGNGPYGAGCIYFYMNGEEPYCFQDGYFPFSHNLYMSSADLDSDGNMEIVLASRGTGNSGVGDWYCRILKYKDHTMTEMKLPSDYADCTELKVMVAQEMQKDTYSAYCPYFDETIIFHAENAFEPFGGGGSNCRGFYDLECINYKGGSALEASEYLYGEGGIAHAVGIAKFIIVWDEEGNSRAEKWWIEPWGG